MTLTGTAISFNNNSLQTGSIIIYDISHENLPTINAKSFALAHANRSTIPFLNYPDKSIKVSGQINSSTIAGLDSAIDTFKGYFTGIEGNLDIGYNGSTRRYLATPNNVIIDRPGGLLYANFEIDFICTIPFGYNTTNTTALSASGRTLGIYNDSYTFLGSVPYQLPIITITPTAVGDITIQSIKWGNGSNSQIISVSRIWAANDILVIDCLNKIVTVNGLIVDFSGAFPEFGTGSQTFQYYDTFSSRTFNISVVYAPRYF